MAEPQTEVTQEENGEQAAADAPVEEASEAANKEGEPTVVVDEPTSEAPAPQDEEAKEEPPRTEEADAENPKENEGQEPDVVSEAVEGGNPEEQQQASEPVEGEVEKVEEGGDEAVAPAEEGAVEAESAESPPEADEAEAEQEAGTVEGDTSAAEGEPKPEGEEEGKEEKGEAAGDGEEVVKEEGAGDEAAADEEKKEGEEMAGNVDAEVTEEGQKEETEGVETSVVVGEKLSRGPTPDAGAPQLDASRLEATTPERMYQESPDLQATKEEAQVVAEEEEVDEPHFRREELIEKYHEALADREQLQSQNYSLQNKLAEYFKKKKADERQDYDKNITDQEQRYLKYMAQLEDLRRQDSMEKENYRAQIEESKARCQFRKETVDKERSKFMEFKMQVALKAINSRSGKPIPPKDIEQYMINETKKEKEVVDVRLENIKLKNKLKKKEQQLKSKEELAEGLHLIDFEQLKIENQTYNEKIEERNEELLKLRKKITSTVQVLTHLKEKLQFVQGERLERSESLKEVEASLAQSRDILSRTKQARDALRIDNQRLRQNCGLLGNEPLLRDFEERKDEGDDLRTKLEQLKMKHAELTLHCNQVRRKIEQARATMS